MIDVKKIYRSIVLVDSKISVENEIVEDCEYAYYIYDSYGNVEKHFYTKLNTKMFDMHIVPGIYEVVFFYKFNGKFFDYKQVISIVDKLGEKNLVVARINNFFIGQNNEPVLKRVSKDSLKNYMILKNEAKKLGDSYPGKRFDIVIMTLSASEALGSEYLFIAIDSFSKEIYFDIYGSTSYIHVASFIENLIAECPYSIDHISIDNTLAIKGLSKLSKLCKKLGIKYELVPMYQFINKSKSLAVIAGLIKELYRDITFESKRELVEELITLTNKYNFFEKNVEIGDMTPYQKIENYFK
ncbi:hypothetical protein LA56_1015 [Francisella philomiragia]|uniref:hypothetical protein n=1 Tax=Francisella philomiragia TaxID=28110 RepID=UPI0005A56179|nr:hypothetical protein [Francisella philomiragia]AJI54775.1 hypothetical protein LA56_1015 [Francisella philomiragia]MBK2253742.1 hypothetical protein [Francisella philomiragia]